MKKILIFSLAYYPHHVSGAEAAIREITDRMPDIGFHMVTLRWGKERIEERIGNVVVHRVGSGDSYVSKMLFPLLAARKARQLHVEHDFDAVWAMMTYMLLPVMYAKILGVRAPHLLSLQDGDSYEKVFGRVRIRPFLPLIDRGFSSSTGIQAISKHLAEWPVKRGYRGEVVVIHNGANPRDLNEDYADADVSALKREFGKKEGEVYLVNTARLESQKGNDTAIRALTLLPENIKLLLVGAGTEEQMLRRLSSELGLSERVIFAGQVPREKVTLYRKAADIFVGPSRSEGLGNAFLSAMASALPVVATREGGLAEFVFGKNSPEGQTAWVIGKDSPQDIAEAVQEILAHPEKVREVTSRAREMVREEFTWDHAAEEMRKKFFAPALSSSPIERARRLAEDAHRGQKRKTDGSAYIEHPREVARIVAEEGYGTSVIAAAWVHDVAEDSKMTLEDISRKLGADVAAIAGALTEDKSLGWEERKQKYIEAIRHASTDAQIVALADKVHNLRSLLSAYVSDGKAVWQKFNRGKDKKLWFEEKMLEVFKEKLKNPLVQEYERLVAKMRELD